MMIYTCSTMSRKMLNYLKCLLGCHDGKADLWEGLNNFEKLFLGKNSWFCLCSSSFNDSRHGGRWSPLSFFFAAKESLNCDSFFWIVTIWFVFWHLFDFATILSKARCNRWWSCSRSSNRFDHLIKIKKVYFSALEASRNKKMKSRCILAIAF